MIFNLDLNKNNAINPIIFGRLTDGNLRKITVNITNEGEPVDLTGWVIRFEGVTGGHAKVFDVLGVNILDAKNGKFEYTFSKTAFSATGAYRQAYFAIEKDNMRETTNDIKIIVENVADLDAQDAETVVTELNKTITLINQRYVELNNRVDIYEGDIAELESWLDERKAEIENIIDLANSTFNQKLSEIQAKLNETNQAIVNGDFYSKTETDQKLNAINTTITNHTNDKTNPHAVTASQTGAYTKAEVANLINQAKLDANPIGTILTTTNSANPSNYLGGTWERYGKGQVLVGVDENDDDFNEANKTGGEKEHTLTIDEMPSHTHQVGRWNPSGSGFDQNQRKLAAAPNNGTGVNGAVETAANGGSKAHNNMQPYISVYMFRRTA